MSEYSLNEVVCDGIVCTKRWIHHFVIKALLQHTLPWIAIVSAVRVIHGSIGPVTLVVFAILAGPVFWLMLVVKERIWPSDPASYPLWWVLCDKFTDWALSCTPAVFALALARMWYAFAILLTLCTVAYVGCHRHARP